MLVVIPALNEERHIDDVLKSVLQPIPEHAMVQVAVADGGSTDRTVARVRLAAQSYPNLFCIHNPDRFQSAAVNLAVRMFGRSADVLIRCDAHAVYPDRFCERVLRTLEASDADSVVVPMDTMGETPFQRAVAWASNSFLGSGGSAHRAGLKSGWVDHGHHAAFRLDTFRRVGGYDVTFTHNEDAEYDCRQRALGANIYLDAGIRVVYKPRRSFAALAKQYFNYGVGRSRTLRRHPGSVRLRQAALPCHLFMCTLSFGLAPWLPFALFWPGLYSVVLMTGAVLIALRQRAPCALLCGPVAAVMHFSWAAGFVFGLSRPEPRWRARMTVPLESMGLATRLRNGDAAAVPIRPPECRPRAERKQCRP